MQALQEVSQLKNWHDLWFDDNKRTGYVAVTDFKRQMFYGSNDIEKIVSKTAGKRKQFISINAFDVDWKNKVYSRETARLKQIRNIAIDIDQYNLDLSIDETLDEIQSLVMTNRIPEPNLILTSRGIQLFYSINRGASPDMAWLTSYITEQLISKMKHVGADSNAKDMSRVMRVPNSVNERNDALVKPSIWNDTKYSLQELQSYCRPLDRFETRQKKQWNIVYLPMTGKLAQMYKTNYARLRDFNKLIELRQGDFTGMRNVFLYMYSYHQSLVLNTQKDVLISVKKTFESIYSKTDKPMSIREFERTVKSAYKDAREFYVHCEGNGFNVIYNQNDGIKKPYNTSNIIKMLNIKEDEQRLMGSIRNSDIEREQRAAYMRNKRRSEGAKPMSEYQNQRKQQQNKRFEHLKQLLLDNPNLTHEELSQSIGVSTKTIQRLKNLL